MELYIVEKFRSLLHCHLDFVRIARNGKNFPHSAVNRTEETTSEIKSLFFVSNIQVTLMMLKCHEHISNDRVFSSPAWQSLVIGHKRRWIDCIDVVWNFDISILNLSYNLLDIVVELNNRG